MSEPTGAGWTSPGEPRRTPPPEPLAAPPAGVPAQGWSAAPVPSSWQGQAQGQVQGQPAWQGQAGWQGQPAWQGQPGWQGQAGWASSVPQAPRPGVVPLRPLGLGELLDGSVGLVRGYPRPALGVSAVLALVTTLVQLVLVFTLLRPLFDVDPAALRAGDTDALVGLFAGVAGAGSVALVFGTVSSAVLSGFMTGIAGKAVLGQPLTSAELWATTRSRLLRLVGVALLVPVLAVLPVAVGAAVLAGLAVVSGAAGTVVGGLLLVAASVLSAVTFVRLSLASPVVVLEDAGVRTSLRRSWSLVRGSSWRVLGVLLLTVLIGSVVAQVLQLPFSLLGGDSNPFAALSGGSGSSVSSRSLALTTIGAGVASTLVAPFTAGVRALLYVDRRMRAEGLDVALQAAAVRS